MTNQSLIINNDKVRYIWKWHDWQEYLLAKDIKICQKTENFNKSTGFSIKSVSNLSNKQYQDPKHVVKKCRHWQLNKDENDCIII